MPQAIPDHFDNLAARVNADLRARGVEDLRHDTAVFRSRRALAEAALDMAARTAPAPAPFAQEARKPSPAPAPTPDPISALRGRCSAALAVPEAWARPRQTLALALAAPLEGDALRAVLRTLPTDAAAGPVDFTAAGAGETDAAALADAKRAAAIMSLPEAEGRTAHAVTFAVQTGMSPDQARAVLARMPKAAPVQTIASRAAAEAEFGGGGGDDLAHGGRGASAADQAWSRAIAGINGKVLP
jgi:hypothetical protein